MVVIGGAEYPDTIRFILPWAASLLEKVLRGDDTPEEIMEWLEHYYEAYHIIPKE